MTRKVIVPKNLPFLDPSKKKDPSATRTQVTVAGVSPMPSNKEVLALGSKYKTATEPEFIAKIKEVRKFFLNEVAPSLICLDNGLSDSKDILRVAFNEDPDVAFLFQKLRQTAAQAAVLKIVKFISVYMGLDAEQAEALLHSTIRPSEQPGKSNELQEILRVLSQDKNDRENFRKEMREMKKTPPIKREVVPKEN